MAKRFGSWVWFELYTPDIQRAKGFYGELFGWKVVPAEMEGAPPYALITVPGRERGFGGFLEPPSAEVPPHWLSYVSVRDVDDTLKRIVAEGGTQYMEPEDIPKVGRICTVADPGGSPFGLLAAEGDDPPVNTEVGTFWWNELWSSDVERALAFYEAIFGYSHDTMPSDSGPYYVIKHGDNPIAGIMQSPMGELPSLWVPYVKVKDSDGTAARASKLGGKVLHPPSDIPEVGRFTVLGDPRGAVLAAIVPAPR